MMIYSDAEYRAAIRYVCANNPYCTGEEHARETLDRLIRQIAESKTKTTYATGLGLLVMRENGANGIVIAVNPALAQLMDQSTRFNHFDDMRDVSDIGQARAHAPCMDRSCVLCFPPNDPQWTPVHNPSEY